MRENKKQIIINRKKQKQERVVDYHIKVFKKVFKISRVSVCVLNLLWHYWNLCGDQKKKCVQVYIATKCMDE